MTTEQFFTEREIYDLLSAEVSQVNDEREEDILLLLHHIISRLQKLEKQKLTRNGGFYLLSDLYDLITFLENSLPGCEKYLKVEAKR